MENMFMFKTWKSLSIEEKINIIRKDNYLPDNTKIRALKDGTVIFINRLAFTWGLYVVGNDDYTPYKYRFCFPHFEQAVKAFDEFQAVNDVPNFGWVAARPENRMLLPRDLFHFTKDNYVTNGEEIDVLIDKSIYTKAVFDRWLKSVGLTLNDLDQGVQHFYKELN